MNGDEVIIVGGGLAGAEAAYQVARLGGRAVIFEMKPKRYSPAHSLPGLAELVCSNSLKSESLQNASGVLKEEMAVCDSLIVKVARSARVPAGSSLSVDRELFSKAVTEALLEVGVEIRREEVREIPGGRPVIIATGPLTTDEFSQSIQRLIGSEYLYFFDAVAPIVYKDSIDFSKAFWASRYDKGDGKDYINCPLNEEEYRNFVNELVSGERVEVKEFEKIPYFEGCMPVEVMAERGEKTLAFGPMKPVGLIDPRTGSRHHAVLQLRRENMEDTIYNMVGFQTRLTYPEQRRIFRMIPGLEGARFARLGKIHRNSYIHSPRLLSKSLSLKDNESVFFAGQITGVEGYVESAATGMLAGISAMKAIRGGTFEPPPKTTVMGALVDYITTEPPKSFQPMNANFGILPPVGGRKGPERKERYGRRAIEDMKGWCKVAACNL